MDSADAAIYTFCLFVFYWVVSVSSLLFFRVRLPDEFLLHQGFVVFFTLAVGIFLVRQIEGYIRPFVCEMGGFPPYPPSSFPVPLPTAGGGAGAGVAEDMTACDVFLGEPNF